MTTRGIRSGFVLCLLLTLWAVPALAQERAAPAAVHPDTYTMYELRLVSVESVWPDVRAVTARQAGGDYRTVLLDAQNRTLAERRIAPPDPRSPYILENGGGFVAGGAISKANAEIAREYRLRSGARSVDETPLRVIMDFGDYTTESLRDPLVKVTERVPGVSYSTFHTILRDPAGAQIGILRWYEREQTLTWRVDGVRGTITPATLAKIGGWKFTPDMVWAGVQALVFHDSYERVKQTDKPDIASLGDDPAQLTCDGQPDGCTGLHWLDGTVYRACCDQHDMCFEYNPPDGCCTAWSWIFPTSWHCFSCNMQVIYCFLTTGGGGGGGSDPCPGGGGGGECSYDSTGYCPPECRMCGSSISGQLMSPCGS